MRCNHVHLQPCTYILDVNKRGVLGSADDDIAFFFGHILSFFIHHGQIHQFSLVFHYFDDGFQYFSLFFSLYGTTESYNATLVERHGFQEKNAYRVRNLGGILTYIYLALNPLKKSGTAFSDFSLFSRCCSLFFQCFFHYFQGVLNYFSLIFQCCYMCFIIFHCLLGICFAIYMHILHICSAIYMEDTGRSRMR